MSDEQEQPKEETSNYEYAIRTLRRLCEKDQAVIAQVRLDAAKELIRIQEAAFSQPSHTLGGDKSKRLGPQGSMS